MPFFKIIKMGDNMHKKINGKTTIIFMLMIASCVFFIAYAQIGSINLIINGTANVTGIKSSEDFDVKFNNVSIGQQASGITVTNDTQNFSDRSVVFNVTGLVGYNDEATITYEVTNDSTYHSALLTTSNTIVNSNPTYFDVECSIVDSNNQPISRVTPGNKAYYKIKVKVIKVPSTTQQTANVTVYLSATSEPYTGS